MVYLFLGQDSLSKDAKLKSLKKIHLPKSIEQFNFDTLYAKELALRELQEKLLCLPTRAKKRIIVIKEAQDLKEDAKEFILKLAKRPYAHIVLILDISRQEPHSEFVNSLSRYAEVCRFKEIIRPNTFALSRQIELKRPDYALNLLSGLLRNGEKPERIMGGLRYVWEKDSACGPERKKRLKLLLGCDIDIKTGRLKPALALERLIVNLCCLGKPFR